MTKTKLKQALVAQGKARLFLPIKKIYIFLPLTIAEMINICYNANDLLFMAIKEDFCQCKSNL